MANTPHTLNLSTLPYRECVGMMLLNNDNHVFVAQRIDRTSEAWQMPQGGIDAGEAPYDAMIRELGEEIGLAEHQVEIITEHPEWLDYDLPIELIPKLWGARFRGQRQRWFILRFLGKDSDIMIETDEPEFNQWKWIPIAELPDIIVPFKRDLYQILADAYAHLAQ